MHLAAQRQSQLYHVLVSPDHSDWNYKVGESATFTIQVFRDQVLAEGVTINYELGPEFFPSEKKSGIVLKDGTMTIKGKMKQPGFLKCFVTAVVDGDKYTGCANVSFDLDKIKPTTKMPADFDQFWAKALEDSRATDLDPRMRLLPEKESPTHYYYEISYAQYNSKCRMYGIMTVPKKEGKFPVMINYPGAGMHKMEGNTFSPDFITIQLGIHGIPFTRLDAGTLRDIYRSQTGAYWLNNLNDRDRHYYKRVYTGCVRLLDFIETLDNYDGKNIVAYGMSQGGALPIIVAALDSRLKAIAVGCPALCDYAGYVNGRAGGWPHYFQTRKPLANEIETLAYFDVVNFAQKLTVPVSYTFGYNDEVCPPTSTAAAYNAIKGNKELHLFPQAEHWTFPEQNAINREWILNHIK